MGNISEGKKQQATDGPSAPGLATGEVEAKLVAIWEELLQRQPIGLREDFFDLGGNSLLAFQVCAKVQEIFDTSLSVTSLFAAPTIEQLALVISGETTPLAASRPPLFCIPALVNIARVLGPDQPFYGLAFPKNDVLSHPDTTTEGIAAECLRQIRAVQPKGPYYLSGFSFGGIVAFEIAQQMIEQEEEVALLALLEPDPPKPYPKESTKSAFRRYWYHVRRMARLNPAGQFRYLMRSLRRETARRAPSLFPSDEPAIQERIFAELTEAIHERYQAKRYRGSLKLLLARDTLWRESGPKDPRLDWFGYVTGTVDICDVPGNHDDFSREPLATVVAEKLASYLAEATPMNSASVPGQD